MSRYCKSPETRQGHLLALGLVHYEEGLRWQQNLRGKRLAGKAPDTLVLLEHPPVITVGRSGGLENLLVPADVLAREGVSLYLTDRGGNITYHGPGQLVGYPIIDLSSYGCDVHRYVWLLEETLLQLLSDYGLAAHRRPGYPGVWVGQDKIAALGVHVRRWVTSHGFALNIQPDLKHFSLIRPCGIADGGVTSMAALLGRPIGLQEVASALAASFEATFGLRLTRVEANERAYG